jgi:hypothetical protein
MRGRVRIPILFLIWILIGIVVAINKGYGDHMQNASGVGTFILAAVLWPVLSLGGAVALHF